MHFNYLDNDYLVIIEKKNNKNLYIRVTDNLEIKVTCNYLFTKLSVKKVLEENRRSIEKMIDKQILKNKMQKKEAKNLLGEKLNVIYKDVKRPIYDSGVITVKDDTMLNNWYKKYAKDVFKKYLDEAYYVFDEKIPYPIIKVRSMKTRWGVCNRRDNSVTLNLELIKKDPMYLNYVIVHELSHFVHFDHSKDNKKIKYLNKLRTNKFMNEEKKFVVEGMHLVNEAKKSGLLLETYSTSSCDFGVVNNVVSKSVMDYISTLPSKTDVIGIVKFIKEDLTLGDKIIILDDVQDPGNLGTILRTLDSANLSQVVVSKDTVDAYNPKVVRSTMGAIFRVNIVETENLKETLKEMKRHKYKVMCTDLTASKNIYEVDYTKKILVIGNESNGISKELLDMADEKIIIPMLGKTESLNASVATSIIVYEYVRRKIGIRIEIWVGIWGRSLNPYL